MNESHLKVDLSLVTPLPDVLFSHQILRQIVLILTSLQKFETVFVINSRDYTINSIWTVNSFVELKLVMLIKYTVLNISILIISSNGFVIIIKARYRSST